MDRGEVRTVVEDSWRQLDAALADLDAAALAEPGVVGDWSVKDLVGHVAAWEQRALHLIAAWRGGAGRDGIEDVAVEDYNAAEAERRHAWSLAQVQAEAAETRAQLRQALEALTDEDWVAPLRVGEQEAQVGTWVGNVLGGALPGSHADEHAGQIWSWRVARARRCAGALADLAAGRSTLLEALAGLREEDFTRPDVDGGWSVCAILAHLAAWDRQVVLALDAWLEGGTPPVVSDIDGLQCPGCSGGWRHVPSSGTAGAGPRPRGLASGRGTGRGARRRTGRPGGRAPHDNQPDGREHRQPRTRPRGGHPGLAGTSVRHGRAGHQGVLSS